MELYQVKNNNILVGPGGVDAVTAGIVGSFTYTSTVTGPIPNIPARPNTRVCIYSVPPFFSINAIVPSVKPPKIMIPPVKVIFQ